MIVDKTSVPDKLEVQTLIYSRVSGYYNPISNFNKGKREEFSERKYYDVNKAMSKEI